MIAKYRGLNVIEHDGRDPGYRAHLIRFPDQHLAVACLCNLVLPNEKLPGALVRQVADVYLEGQLPVATQDPEVAPPQRAIAPAALPPAEWAEYEGQYYSDEIDTVYNVERHGSSISITRPQISGDAPDAGFSRQIHDVGLQRRVVTRHGCGLRGMPKQHVTGLLIDGDQPLQLQVQQALGHERTQAPSSNSLARKTLGTASISPHQVVFRRGAAHLDGRNWIADRSSGETPRPCCLFQRQAKP